MKGLPTSPHEKFSRCQPINSKGRSIIVPNLVKEKSLVFGKRRKKLVNPSMLHDDSNVIRRLSFELTNPSIVFLGDVILNSRVRGHTINIFLIISRSCSHYTKYCVGHQKLTEMVYNVTSMSVNPPRDLETSTEILFM